MQLGIFAKTFVRPTFEETLDAVRAHGLHCLQFNMACAGLPSLPDDIDPDLCKRIRREIAARQITMTAISGTFNMIHPDRRRRQEGLRRLRVLAEACPRMDTHIITLCTGTRDPDNMWRTHPDNDSPAAWADLVDSLEEALSLTEKLDVQLAFEPETANVVDSADKASLLLRKMRSPRLKVVIDPANLFRRGDIFRMCAILDEAFDLLAEDLVLAHAKDFVQYEGEIRHVAAGTGLLDYDYYLDWLQRIQFPGPLIVHGLDETEVAPAWLFCARKR